MPQSYIEYTSGLSETTFSVPFKYISVDDVHALGYNGTNYTSLVVASRSHSAKTITLAAAPSAYTKLRIYRATSNTQLVDFQNGSRLSESDLDTAYQQGLFVAQEVSEDASTTQFQRFTADISYVNTIAAVNLDNYSRDSFTASGSTDTFSLGFNAVATYEEAYIVSIDGALQQPVTSYSINTGNNEIVFTSKPPSGAVINVVTMAGEGSAGAPSWGTNGITSLPSNGTNSGCGLELNYGLVGEGPSFVDFHSTDASNPDYDARIIKDAAANSDFRFENAGSGNITFNNNGNERMRITNEGSVMVGTTDLNPYDNATSAGIALHGAGSSQAGLITSARVNSTAAAFNRIGTNGSVVNFRKDGSSVGSISVTASSTAYNTSSDYRLKEDIIELDDSTERLKTLKPCNFRWKADGTRVDGFIAHEAQEVVPEAVTGTKDAVDKEGNPDYQGIDQSKLVPLLTKALQEAITKIETLEARVGALENA